MRSFRFEKGPNEHANIEEALKFRKRRIAKQQMVFTTILLIILVLLISFLYRKIVYNEFDGYVNTDINIDRSIDDEFIEKIYVQEGTFVIPGDTLYSFIYLKPLIEQMNRNSEPDIVVRERNLKTQELQVKEEISVLQAKIKHLQRQIKIEENDISFGLSTNSHKLDLQRQLAESQSAVRSKMVTLSEIQASIDDVGVDITNSSFDREKAPLIHDVILTKGARYKSLIQYRLATDSAIVIDMARVEGDIAFRSEEILSMLPTNIRRINYNVWCYVPSEDMPKIRKYKEVDIIVNDELKVRGEFGMVGVRTEELPSHLKSNFTRQGRVSIVQVKVLPGQVVPQWAIMDGLPVKVRINNLTQHGEPLNYDNSMWFNMGHGMIEESKRFFNIRRREAKPRGENQSTGQVSYERN